MHNLIIYWKPAVEIVILWFLLYRIMLFFEGTRALQPLRGIIILVLVFLVFQKFDFFVLSWLFEKLFGISVIAILIIFHPEIRMGLAQLGKRQLFKNSLKEEEIILYSREVAAACEYLVKNKFGALIAIEKDDSLSTYIKSGVGLDARVCADLIEAIFTPNNPLHDGGLIISRGRIAAAGCIFPLAVNEDLSRMFGTRHRAALGLSEDSDAILVIVSEERRDVSLIYQRKFYKDLGVHELEVKIKELLKLKINE